MTSDSKTDPGAEAFIIAQGLQRAAELFPATVAAAIERGSKPLIVRDGGVSPVMPPAAVFHPAIRSKTGRP